MRVEIMLIEFNRRFSQIEQLVSISMTITHRRGLKLSNFFGTQFDILSGGKDHVDISTVNKVQPQKFFTNSIHFHALFLQRTFTTKYTNTHLLHKRYLINSHVFSFRLDLILAFLKIFFLFVILTNFFSFRGFDEDSFIKVISFTVESKLIFWILIKRSTWPIRKLHTSEYKELVI